MYLYHMHKEGTQTLDLIILNEQLPGNGYRFVFFLLFSKNICQKDGMNEKAEGCTLVLQQRVAIMPSLYIPSLATNITGFRYFAILYAVH